MHAELGQLFGGSIWLIDPPVLRILGDLASKLTPATIQAAQASRAQRRPPAPVARGGIAVIPMAGPIVYRSSWLSDLFQFCAIEDLRAMLSEALDDPSVGSILFRCNSPGGSVDMVSEFAEEIFVARGRKPIVFVADPMIASAAYWLASQGNEIVATRSSQVGAIGAFCTHADLSGELERDGIKITLIYHGAHKVDANPYEPLSDDAREDLQKYVDYVGNDFENAVARGRGVSPRLVRQSFGQGRIFQGNDAIRLGLADTVGRFDDIVMRAGQAARLSARALEDEQFILRSLLADDQRRQKRTIQ